MKNFNKIAILGLLAAIGAFAQSNTIVQTSLSSAVKSTDIVVNLTSATGVVAYNASTFTPASILYVVDPGQRVGESMSVVSIAGTAITVRRNGPQAGFSGGGSNLGGAGNGSAVGPPAHASGAMVLIGPPGQFVGLNPTGACVTASTYVSPVINTATGEQWLCSTITKTWVPGWGNFTAPNQVTVAVASVAGATAVNSPLQHITGALAITSFTMGIGWQGEGFCIIPDAAFTTTATNNILKASTAVIAKALCFTYDFTNTGFVPSY